MTEHLPAHVVDQLTAGVLAPDGAASARAHAAGCADCAAKLSAAMKAREDFLAMNPPALRAEALLARSSRRRWLVWLAPAVALAAAAVIFVVPPASTGMIEKGGPAVDLWVARPSTGKTWRPAPGEVLSPGDRVQLQVTPAGHTRVTVYSVDPHGARVQLYTQAVSGPASLEQSLVLDEQPGAETLELDFTGGDAAPVTRIVQLQKK